MVEHIDNDIEFLASIFKALKPGGNFYCTVPAYNFLWSQEDINAGHYRRYSLKEFKAKMNQVGFEVTYASYFFSVLIFPIFIFRSLPSKFGLSKKVTTQTSAKDHDQSGFISKMMQFCWNWELKRIQRLGRIPFGSSCLIVAKKI